MNLDYLPELKGEFYTTESALREIKSVQAKNLLDLFQSTHRIRILPPNKAHVKLVRKTAKDMGQLELSTPDVEILAIALMLNELNDVNLLSDDFGLRNVAHKLQISSSGVKTTGGNQLREFVYICTACGNKHSLRVEECDVCGSVSFRRRKR